MFEEIIKECDRAITNANNIRSMSSQLNDWINSIEYEKSKTHINTFKLNGNFQKRPTVNCSITFTDLYSQKEFCIMISSIKNNTMYKLDFNFYPESDDDVNDRRKVYTLFREWNVLTRKGMTFDNFKRYAQPFCKYLSLHEYVLLMSQTIKELKMDKDFK